MSIYSKRANARILAIYVGAIVPSLACSVQANDASDTGFKGATERIEAGLVHLDTIDRSDADGPDDSTYAFVLYRSANLLEESGLDKKKKGLQFGSLSLFPEFSAYVGDMDDKDYLISGDFGFRLPVWSVSRDQNARKEKCWTGEGEARKRTRCGGYDFDFQPTLSFNATPGFALRDEDEDEGGGSSLDWHVDIGAEYHLWLKKPERGGGLDSRNNTEADPKQTYADITVGVGRDYFDRESGDFDGHEDYVSGHFRWRTSESLEFSVTGYYGDTEFDTSGVPGSTAESVSVGARYSLAKDWLGIIDLSLYADLNYGWHTISPDASAKQDIDYESISPMLSIRWPDRAYKDQKGTGFGFWSQGAAAACFANPVCRLAVFGVP